MSNTETPVGTPGGPVALPDLPDKLRVHALAKLLGRTSRDVLAVCADLQLEIRSPQSSIDRKTAEVIATTLLGGEGQAAAPAPAAEVPAAEVPAAQAPVAEAPVPQAAAVEAPVDEVSDAQVPAPRTRRRRATRAAAPAEASTPDSAETPAPDAPAADAPAADAPAADVSAVDVPAAAASEQVTAPPAPRTRRRATRATAAPAAEAPAAEAPAVEAPAAEIPAEAPAAADAPAPRTRRRRATRATAPAADAPAASEKAASETAASETAAPVADALELPAAEPAAAAPALAPLFAPPAPLFQPPSRPSRSRRRAVEEPEAEPVDEPVVEPPAAVETADAEPATDAVDGDDSDDENGDGARRRRRRGRRGRGRGRGGEGFDDESDDSDDAEVSDDPAASGADATSDDDTSETAESSEDTDSDDGDDDDKPSGSRRRRRRRRRGSGDDDASRDENDPPGTVTRVRPPRSERASEDTEGDGVQGVRGSTRLEAKRQRRRDGRDAGRRRVPILSEAEFLARREAVDRVMVARERGDRVEIGVLEDDVLVEHFIADSGGRDGGAGKSMVGNIYLGRVQNVLPSMEAAFVDIGRGRNAVLYAGEVDWDAAGLGGKARKIEQALHSGDAVLVQVTKDPVGHKGARLTTQISLAGRFLVYVPSGGAAGISRKLPDVERKRLKDILKEIVPAEAGVIIRTASEGVSHEALERDVRRLQAQWEVVKEKSEKTGPAKPKAPVLLYEEPDLLIKVVRDQFNEDFSTLVISGDESWSTLHSYIGHVAPELVDRLHRHVGPRDVFAEYRIDEQLLKALDRKVWLPSGGTLVIDRTEAMTVVDVNTGKYTGSGGNLEETVTRNNLEAAEEVVRQLRLRDIGGIIVVDFIDMVLEANRDLVLRRLTECLSRDRTRHQVAEVTSLGLVQMTRKRVGGGLLEHFSTPCEHCRGRGVVVDADPVPPASERGEGSRRTRGGRGRRDGEDRNGADRNGSDRNGNEHAGNGHAGNGVRNGSPVDVMAARAEAAALRATVADAPAADAVVAEAVVTDGLVSDVAMVDVAVADVVAADAAVDVGAPAVPVPADAGTVEDAAEESAVRRAAARETAVTLTDVEPDTGDDSNGHQSRPARRRGRVTRTAGAPTAAGAAPAAVVVTLPAEPEAVAAPVETAGAGNGSAPAPAAEPAAAPQPEPAPATTRTRRPRRAASRPAGPPPAVESGGDPV